MLSIHEYDAHTASVPDSTVANPTLITPMPDLQARL